MSSMLAPHIIETIQISTLGYNDRKVIEEISTNDASLQSFTTGIMQYADQYGFQGIDLGWPWTGGDGVSIPIRPYLY